MSETPPLPVELEPLLSGLDDAQHAARLALVRELLAHGHSIDDLLRAGAEDRLALLPVTEILREEGERTVADIAHAQGVQVDDLLRSRAAMGLPVVLDEPVYGSSLERHAARLREVLETGLHIDELVAFNYVMGAALTSIAAAARDSVHTVLDRQDPAGTEHSRAVNTAELAQAMSPLLAEVVTIGLADHIRQVARREVTATLISSDSAALTDVTIAFADLVGFTALGDVITPDRLGAVAIRLAELAHDSCTGTALVVKTLGDGVMFSARSADDAVATVRELVRTAADAGLPRLHVGAAHGPALARAGDWYGSVVNRASRLSGLARPGHIVIDDDVHAGLSGDDDLWADLGPTDVRGLTRPVHCWTATV